MHSGFRIGGLFFAAVLISSLGTVMDISASVPAVSLLAAKLLPAMSKNKGAEPADAEKSA